MEKHSQISVAGTYHLTPQDHVWGNSPLHSACYHGKLDIVQLLILEQPSLDLNMRNHRGDSPLTLACQAGHLDVIHFLLTLSSCDVTHTNKAGDTPLHVACSEGHTAAVKVLCSLDKCAVDGRNRRGNSPLALACRGGHLDVLEFLVESMHSSTATQNKDGDTPLHVACSHGNFQVVKFLVSISISNINTKNADGNTSLHLACQNGWKHIVEFLINEINHVNVNQPNNDDNTPLHVAISSHQKDIANLLSHHHKCNIKIANKDGNMPLHLVCMEGRTDIVQYLLGTRGNDANVQNKNGNTPLHISCLKGHAEIVKIIITQKSCDINCKNERGNTPLTLACLEGKLGVVRLLVDMEQCDLNHENKAGVCALHLACYNSHQSVVEVLIRHDRCDVNCTDAVENTPLGLAANLSWTDIVKFLITEKQCNINHLNKFRDTPLHLSKCVSVASFLKCDVNHRNKRGDTALGIACQCNLDFVRFLIETKHCKVDIQNDDGDSPLHHACRHGRLSIVKYLLTKQLLPVNCENNTGDTPLCVAAGTVDSDVVQFLVEIDDCDVNHQEKDGDTPLHIACRIGDIRVVRALTDFRNRKGACGFNVTNKQQETPALIAFNKHHNDILRLLVTEHRCACECLLSVLERIDKARWSEAVRILIADKTITIPSFVSKLKLLSFLADNLIKHGNTLLHFLCQYSENPTLLINEHEAVKEVNCCNDAGNTPLHLACLAGNVNAVQFLTNITDCKTNIKNNQQETPALIAFTEHHNDIFRLLTTEHHCACECLLSVLERIDKAQWSEAVGILIADKTITIPSFGSKLKVLSFLADTQIKRGNTLLHFLCQYSENPALLIHKHQAVKEVNCCNDAGNTPLHLACLAGNVNGVRFLTNITDCKTNVKNIHKETPALIAFRNRHSVIFRLLVTVHSYENLLSVLESIDVYLWPKVVKLLTRDGTITVPPQFESQFDVIQFLFNERVWDLNGLDYCGNTPLHIACLADCHCSVKNKHGNTALSIACQCNLDLVKFLIETKHCKVQIRNKSGDSLLHHACRNGKLSIVKYLVNGQLSPVNCENNTGDTPLCVAAGTVFSDVVQFLVEINDCDVNHQNKRGNTALSIACQFNLDIVKILIETQHCTVQIRNKYGDSPLHHACRHGKLSIVNYLVNGQLLPINCKYNTGNTPLCVITDCDVNHQNRNGDTPLHIACRNGDICIVQSLTDLRNKKGSCDVNVKNNQQETPALIAFKKHHNDIFRLLVKEHHCACDCLLSVLESITKVQWSKAVGILIADSILISPSLRSKLKVISFLAEEKIWNVDNPIKHGNTLLHFLCQYSENPALLIHKHQAIKEVNCCNDAGNTPLHLACLAGNVKAVQLLTNITDCKTNVKNNQKEIPALIAFRNRHSVIFRLLVTVHSYENLLSVLQSVNKDLWPEVVKLITSDEMITLFPQFESQFDVIHFLFNERVWDLNGLDYHGNTPLHIACSAGDLKVVRIITSFANCTFNVKNSQKETPAFIAYNKHRNDIFRLLVTEHRCACECLLSVLETINEYQWSKAVGILIIEKDGKGITIPSFLGSKLKVISFLAEEKIWNMDNPIKLGNTLLHFLCQYSENPTLLIHKHQAVKEVNRCNKAGNTPLHLACLAGNVKGVQFLTSITDCKTNIKNNQQETPAFIAFRNRHSVIFRLLVTAHSYDNLLTVLESVNKDLWPEVVKLIASDEMITLFPQFESQFDVIHFLFIERVWDLNGLDCHGNISLHIACSAGDLNIVRVITSFANCQCNVRNKQGNTPATIAFQQHHHDVFRLLTTMRHECLLEVLEIIISTEWPDVMKILTSELNVSYGTPQASLKLFPNHQDEHGKTLLHYACLSDNLQIIKFLINDAGCEVNICNNQGDTPLHIACYTGNLGLVQILLEVKNCDVYARNANGEIPAVIALNNSCDAVFRLLVIEQHCVCLLSVLDGLGPDGWQEVVSILSNSRFKNEHFRSLPDVLSFLKQERLWDAGDSDKHGNSELHIACSNHQIDLVAHLLKLGYDCTINCRNMNGDTPLHLACKADRFETARFLIQLPEYTCDMNCQNSAGDTPLHITCKCKTTGILLEYQLDIVHELINSKECNLNHQNENGNTPLHNACESGNLAAVEVLLTKACNINLRNKQGETPALVAFKFQQQNVLKSLIMEEHFERLLDLLHAIDRKRWPDVLNLCCLIDCQESNLPNFTSPVDVIKFLIQSQIWNLNYIDQNGNTALHCACYYGHTELVMFLVNVQIWDIVHANSNGDTPLHIACLQGHSEVVRFILSISKAKESCTPNNQGNTPLHCACSGGHLQVVKVLLSSGLFDPTACNTAGISPLEISRSYQVIRELISKYVGFRSSNPLWLNTKVCVVGNHSTGKTTLVEALQKEATPWIMKFFRKVSSVEPCTCGIIPVPFYSKKIGNVILYDFAGHIEYYSSHAAVLENFRSSSPPPIFIILLKLVEPEQALTRQLYYWTSMIENHCQIAKVLPRVIVVGSFADKIKSSLPAKVKHIKQLLGLSVNDEPLLCRAIPCSLQFVGFVSLDCRVLRSIDTLSNLLAKNCHALQEAADISFGCHVLYALLNDKFEVACTVSEIMACIHSDDAHQDLLSHDTGNVVYLLKQLSDYGDILLLLNQEHPQNSWVILNKSFLLSEINGTVFAPEQFERRYKGFFMSTGVVPFSKLQEAFPKYDTEMITSFLTHLEFCQEVKDPDALGGITATHLQLTQSTTPSAVTERYFFFPALVNLEKPTDVWKDNEAIHYNSGWLLQCTKPDKFLTSRFIHVLLLRLAFSYALTPESHHYPEDPSYPVLRKRCSVWKNGIQWFSRAGGIETIVEVREQTKLVTILMRCPDKAEIECAELRSSVIEKVLSIQKEFCPAVTPMAECLIHPNDVQYPLPHTQQLKLFNHKEIANLVIANQQFAIEEAPSSVMDAQKLLSFEPYLGLGEALVQQLFSDKDADKAVPVNFLDKLAERVFQRMPLFKKMLNTPENEFAECYGQAPVRQCCYLFKLWSQQREKATYRALRKEFDRYSIFHGRNPLEVAKSGTVSPIPLQDIDYDTPDTITAPDPEETMQGPVSAEEVSSSKETEEEVKTGDKANTTVRIVSHPSDRPLKPNTDSEKDATNHNPPTLLELIRFRGWERRINLPQEVGIHYMMFGILLLEDHNGMRIRNMEVKHMKNPEQINMEVLQEWVEGRGKQPVTWDTLIDVLYDTELTKLSSEIAAVKGSSVE